MFKVFFGHTTAIGGAYYRCMCHAFEMKKQKLSKVDYIDYDPIEMGNIPNCWERIHLSDPKQTDAIAQQVTALVRQNDVTVYQHFITPMGLALLRMQQDTLQKPILMDIDDYPFDIPAMNASSEAFQPGCEKIKVTKQQLKLSDGVIVSTNYLKEQFEKYNKNIHVIPNCIDFSIYDKIKNKQLNRGKIRLGHIGASGHVDDRHALRDVLPYIFKKYDNVEVVLVGDCFIPSWMDEYRAQGKIKVVPRWVSIDKYPEYLADFGFDIGLAPLRDYKFSRGKSNLRYLEYGALKIPTVASDVRPFTETIADGKDGYLCSEPEDWIKALEVLIESETKRKEIGEAGYKKVKEEYNLAKWTPKYVKLLKKIKEDYDGKKQDILTDN